MSYDNIKWPEFGYKYTIMITEHTSLMILHNVITQLLLINMTNFDINSLIADNVLILSR